MSDKKQGARPLPRMLRLGWMTGKVRRSAYAEWEGGRYHGHYPPAALARVVYGNGTMTEEWHLVATNSLHRLRDCTYRLLRVLCDADDVSGGLDLREVKGLAREARRAYCEERLSSGPALKILHDGLIDAGLPDDADQILRFVRLKETTPTEMKIMGFR